MSELTATEALNSFIGWLTCRDEVVKIGASEDCAVWAELIDKFSRANNLSEPRSIWPGNTNIPDSIKLDGTVPCETYVQWFKNGDHPDDGTEVFKSGRFKGELLEGKVVRYFRDPQILSGEVCTVCNCIMHDHGWIDDNEYGSVVCPGDMILKDQNDEYLVISLKDYNIMKLGNQE